MKQAGCLLCCLLLLFCAGCSFTPVGTDSASGQSRRESVASESRSNEPEKAAETVSQPTDGMPTVIGTEEVGVDSGNKKDPENKSGKTSASDKKEDSSASGGATISDVRYVGNRNSKVFHKSDCPALKRMKAENQRSFSTRSEAIRAGFHACSQCRP